MKKEEKKNRKSRLAALREEANQKLRNVARLSSAEALAFFGTSLSGYGEEDVDKSRDEYGKNEITKKKKNSSLRRFFNAFVNPFTGILLAIALISLFTDGIQNHDFSTFIIILITVFVSGALRFIQETKSSNEAAEIAKMVSNTTSVIRKETGRKEIPFADVVVGDIISLSAGDMIPADLRILQTKDLFLSQSSLTGESEPVEKTATAVSDEKKSLTELGDIAYMGSTVISGSGIGIVVNVGDSTLFGGLANSLNKKPTKTSFDKGINSLSWLLIRFMIVLVPIVFLVNGFTKKDWLEAFLFAVSIAVGLTPEMLPMIVTTCLANGSVKMAKKKVIIKNLNSIQDLGSIDILCTDKTGTLTQDKVVLEYHVNVMGKEDPRVLRHAFLNSYFQTGLKNLIDIAIINREKEEPGYSDFVGQYTKVDEIPFDFDRRRMSVVVKDKNGKAQMITKGALEEMLSISAFVEYNGAVVPLTEEMKKIVRVEAEKMNGDGMRVIAVAQKTNPPQEGVFSVKDENNMVLIGYLAFLDPPKDSASDAIKAITKSGIHVKVLTGDNDKVTSFICGKVGIPCTHVVLGSDIEGMDDAALKDTVERNNVFAKLSPEEKARIVDALRKNGHRVGYMGDGINDTPALKSADVGISVDTASDLCKESAGIILLEKDLNVLESGIVEGRRTYASMMKYIYMTVSSNFGNIFSVLVGSIFLPFLPMKPLHLLMLNLMYDIASLGIPWDNVDLENLEGPSNWDIKPVSRFMLIFGPISSIFDITTFLILLYSVCPSLVGGQYYSALTDTAQMSLFVTTFQSAWFVESMWTQTLVIYIIRTDKIPFIQSRPSLPLTILTLSGILIATSLPFIPYVNTGLGLGPIPGIFFAYLAGIVLVYLILMNVVKKIFLLKYKRLY
jgi:Mg2+-importing ATPase